MSLQEKIAKYHRNMAKIDHVEKKLELTIVENYQENQKQTTNLNKQLLNTKDQRHWLLKQGKGYYLDFTDEEIKKLKECFSSLDDDGSGAISVEELETPLIGLGFADSREEVENLINLVDVDGSGLIEFDEFLLVIKTTDQNEKTAKINKFFKDLSSGMGNEEQKILSFNQIVQAIRRSYMMDAILCKEDKERIKQGTKILNNVKASLLMKSKRKVHTTLSE